MSKKILAFLLVASLIALVSAYISEFFFNLQPCILCLYQRYVFFALIGIAALALLLRKEKFIRLSFFLCLAALLLNTTIASYQVGVEQKIFRGPDSCASNPSLNEITDIEELRESLMNTKAVRCDEPQFFFMGLSMAAWNVLYCLLLFVSAAMLYRKKSN